MTQQRSSLSRIVIYASSGRVDESLATHRLRGVSSDPTMVRHPMSAQCGGQRSQLDLVAVPKDIVSALDRSLPPMEPPKPIAYAPPEV